MTPTTPAVHSTSSLDGSERTSTESPQRHPKLWFDDGSVILQVENTLFRVHLSILYSCSTVIQDMMVHFEQRSMLDGCPVVVMNDDRSVDWAHTLHVIYDSTSYLDISHSGLAVKRAASILTVSTKYRMKVTRRNCISFLQRFWPTDFDGMLNLKPDLSYASPMVARLLLECQVPSLLVAVLYSISTSYPVDGSRDEDLMESDLPYELQVRCLSGRSRLYTAQSRGENALTFQDIVRCLRKSNSFGKCKGVGGVRCCLTPFEAIDTEIVALSKFPYDRDYLSGTYTVDCHRCLRKVQALYLTRQEKIWESLPKYFGLGESWAELREREEA